MNFTRHQEGHPGRRHHHPHGGPWAGDPAPYRHRGGGRRAPRGDVRAAVLLLLAEAPMHGYQLMQAIAERTGGAWTPSPGAVYPTINQLEDEGLVTVTAEAGRRLVSLTDTGRAYLSEQRERWADPFAGFDAGAGADLRRGVQELVQAIRQVARAGNETQRAAAAKLLTDTRRALYLLLADGSEESGS